MLISQKVFHLLFQRVFGWVVQLLFCKILNFLFKINFFYIFILFGCTNIKNSFFKIKNFKKLSLSHSQTFSNFVEREARFLLQGEKKKSFYQNQFLELSPEILSISQLNLRITRKVEMELFVRITRAENLLYQCLYLFTNKYLYFIYYFQIKNSNIHLYHYLSNTHVMLIYSEYVLMGVT